jgi:hypothetical protein
MPTYQLGHDPGGDIVDRERGAVIALGGDPRVEHHLQQHISEFIAERSLITGLKSIKGLVGIFKQMRRERSRAASADGRRARARPRRTAAPARLSS